MRYLDERHSALSDKGDSSLTQSLSEHGGAACSFTLGKIPAQPLVQHSNLTQDTRISGASHAQGLETNSESNAGLESKFTQSHADSEFAHKEAYKTPFPHLWWKISVQELENGAEPTHTEPHEILGFEMKNRGFGARSEEATLAVVPEAEREQSAIYRSKPNLSEIQGYLQ